MLLIIMFILVLSFAIARGVVSNSSKFAHSAKSKRIQVEMVIPIKPIMVKTEKTIHLTDYREEKRREREKGSVQLLYLESLPNAEKFELYLN